MRRFAAILLVCLAIPLLGRTEEPRKVYFTATDGLKASADLYMPWETDAPFIVLFHRAAWSRGEYVPIAPKLNEMGYNCLTVDQRSGSRVYGKMNETAQLAAQTGKGTEYLDAVPDMVGALEFVRDNYAKGKVVAWGSSYSAALALVIAAEEEELVDGVVAFSPSEYFGRAGLGDTYVADHVAKLKVPILMAFRQVEAREMSHLKKSLPAGTPSTAFLPEGIEGTHGSQALWPDRPGSEMYWEAVTRFLSTHFASENPQPRERKEAPVRLRSRPAGDVEPSENPVDSRSRIRDQERALPKVAPQRDPIPQDPERVPAGKPKDDKGKGPGAN